MNMMKMCLNPKVLAGLAVVAVGLFVFAPGFALSALPLLLVLACPLSMLLIPVMMGRQRQTGAGGAAPGQYTCSMHPQVVSVTPGRCPTCGMDLVQVPPARQPQPASVDGTRAALGREEQLTQLKEQLQQVQDQQAALARQIAELDLPGAGREDGAARGVEPVAGEAGRRAGKE